LQDRFELFSFIGSKILFKPLFGTFPQNSPALK